MPHNFSWVFEGRLAGMGRPGCGLELAGQMLPHERRFLAWLNSSESLSTDRMRLAKTIGLRLSDKLQLERRMLEMYKKFRDVWPLLELYREAFGEGGEPVDRFALNKKQVQADLAFVQKQGVDTLVTLTERPLDEEVLAPFEFEVLHLPVPDKKAPADEQVDQFLDFVDEKLLNGRCVLAHCLGGYGRTGTMLACYLVHCGVPAQEAIVGIREKRPQSIENEEQEQAVFDLEERSG